MKKAYVHGYDHRENLRLQDQASTLVELLHSDTFYPEGSRVLEAGCGVGAQTVTLARGQPKGTACSAILFQGPWNQVIAGQLEKGYPELSRIKI